MQIMQLIYIAFLIINTVTDLINRRIYVGINFFFAVPALFLFVTQEQLSWLSLLGGILSGAYLYLFSLMSKEAVGAGDAIVVTISGIFLGGGKNAAVLMGGLFLTGLCGGILMLCKKAGKKSELPFAPFFTLSYMLLYLGGVL